MDSFDLALNSFKYLIATNVIASYNLFRLPYKASVPNTELRGQNFVLQIVLRQKLLLL